MVIWVQENPHFLDGGKNHRRKTISKIAMLCAGLISFQPLGVQATTPSTAADNSTNPPTSEAIPPSACGDSNIQNDVRLRLGAWLREILPSKLTSEVQKANYTSGVDQATIDRNPPVRAANAPHGQVVYCSLRFSAMLYDAPADTPGNGRLDPIEIKSVPYAIVHGYVGLRPDLDLPPANFQLNELTPGEKRLLASFYYRGQQLYPSLASPPNSAKRAQAASHAKIAATSRSTIAKPPANAAEGYNAMFASAHSELQQILRAQGLGAYAEERRLTPAQQANRNRRIRACENAGGTWGTRTARGSFATTGPEGCYFMQIQR
jgi:hypothetical protein